MIEFKYTGDELYARMERAVALVEQRLNRTVAALETASIPYAIIGGFGVQAWVSRFDPAAIRGTPDVDVLVNRSDFDRVRDTMAIAGFLYRQTDGADMFVEHFEQRDREAIDVHFAGESMLGKSIESLPDLAKLQRLGGYNTVPLEALVRMKLNAYRTVDRVHVQDMISVGMIDETWLSRFPPALSARLKDLLDDPNG